MDEWASLIRLVSAIVVSGSTAVVWLWTRWRRRRPVSLLLQQLTDEEERVVIYTRDFESMVLDPIAGPKRVKLLVREPLVNKWGEVANVPTLWSRAEALVYGAVLYVFSLAGKTERIEVVEMSDDKDRWDDGLVVLGAQTERCYRFYRDMNNVAFSMDDKNIYNQQGVALDDPNMPVDDQGAYRYGIILKARNPYRTVKLGTCFLIGGFGVEGTEAAGYYFRHYYKDLVSLFGNRAFGVVVRVRADASAQTVVRVPVFDTSTEKKPFWTRRLWEFIPGTTKQLDT